MLVVINRHDPQMHSALQAATNVVYAVGTPPPLDGHRAAGVAHDMQVGMAALAARCQSEVRRIDFEGHW